MNGTALLAVLAALLVAAKTKLTFSVAGSTVAMPVLWLVAAIVALLIAAVVLFMLRSMARDGWPGLRPRTAGT